MRKEYRGVNLKEVNNKKDLSDNLENIFKKFVQRICDNYDLDSGTKLAFWLNYWCHNYIPIERKFDYESQLLRYKRGDIISLNLGFNVGSEQGGLHYAIVLNNINDKSNKVLTIIPLSTHEKENKDEEDYLKYEVLIDNSIFDEEVERLKNKLASFDTKLKDDKTSDDEKKKILKEIKATQKELDKISSGDKIYAQPAQVKTVSKLRIYYPTEVDDILYGVNVGDTIMQEIEEKMIELFFNKKDK